MLVADKYRLHRQIGWSDEAEVHAGPPDAIHGVPLAVKLRHGMGGPPRPDGNRERFLRAINDQQAAVLAGCKQIAPVFEAGHEGNNAFYVSPHYQRSVDSLIQGRVALDPAALHHVTMGVLTALEQLRDRHGRPHGNLKPTNIFLEGKSVRAATVVLGDLALRESITSGEGGDCYALGAVIFQLVRGRSIRHFDWPIVPGDDWTKLGPQADAWREFCNVLMSPETGARPDALVAARAAFKNMRRLGAAARRTAGAAGEGGARSSAPGRKGLFTGIGAALAALAAGGAVLFQPADSKLGRQVRSIAALAPLIHLIDPHPRMGGTGATDSPLSDSSPNTPGDGPDATTSLANVSPTPVPGADVPTPTPDAMAAATPAPTVAPTATPLPENPGDKWIGYTALLQQLRRNTHDPAMLDQPEILTGYVTRLKDSVSFLPIKDEPTVATFLKKMPPKIEATGDQPDLPPNLWTKESASREGDVQSVVYQWGKSGFQLPFNRVAAPGGNNPAFYLSATTVPVRFGVVLAKMAEADGKGPLSGAASIKGPVSWEFVNGNYSLRNAWLTLDSVNAAYYANAGRPSADSPMNGLSAIEAGRLARAAGCGLPTLAQWDAVLASPAGQHWTAEWQTAAKVRGPQWAALAKGIQAQHVTGAKLPNDQCFGDRNDVSAVGPSADQNLFFDPVGSHVIGGFANLIGNVGQYVVDDARNPTKYYFAGGSAESAPSVFQSLTAPPPVVSPFLTSADGGVRLAVLAKGNGSEKNPALDKLNADLDAELARVEKLQ